MARPAVHPLRVREETLQDLRDEFLLRCQAKNLSARTIEWYEERTRFFAVWCQARGIERASELTTSVLEGLVIEMRASGLAPNTVRGYAQILKTMARLGHRKGLIPVDITADFEMPKVPQVIIRPSRTSNFAPCSSSRTPGHGSGSVTGPSSRPSLTPWSECRSWSA